MLSKSFHKFLRDERGAYTIWSLIWFSLYVAMGGLAVDMTDAYRNQTLLQSTADASALAGGMSLPDQPDAPAQSLGHSLDHIHQRGIVKPQSHLIMINGNLKIRRAGMNQGNLVSLPPNHHECQQDKNDQLD